MNSPRVCPPKFSNLIFFPLYKQLCECPRIDFLKFGMVTPLKDDILSKPS